MKTTHLVSSLALAALLASPIFASAQEQGERRGSRSPEEQVKAMKESLKITDEQAEKLKPVFAKVQEKQKALRDDTNLSQEDRRSKMREIYAGVGEELKPILTPEQLAKWKEEREKRRAERAKGSGQ